MYQDAKIINAMEDVPCLSRFSSRQMIFTLLDGKKNNAVYKSIKESDLDDKTALIIQLIMLVIQRKIKRNWHILIWCLLYDFT